jgi:DNA mismatch endonuclease (patch repair protein)
VDVHEPAVRSYNMSRIRSKDTKPEILVRKFLHSQGFRFRLNKVGLPGKPDLVFPKLDKVIFIHGCFWHGHNNCKYFVIPKTRRAWWLAKILGNKKRDTLNLKQLKKLGWSVHVIYECDLRSPLRALTLDRAIQFLKKAE